MKQPQPNNMEQLPKIVRERLEGGAKPVVHPDPDLLTAFAEQSLIERERLPVLEHLSICADCREVVALAQPELVMEQVAVAMAAVPASPASSRPHRSDRLIFGWAAIAACVLVGFVLLHYQSRENKFPQMASKQAMNAAPAPSPAQPAAPAAEDALAAKLEPPTPRESKPQARAEKTRANQAGANKDLAPGDRVSARLMAKKLGRGSGQTAGAMALRTAPPIPQSTEQVTVSGAENETADEAVALDKTQAEPQLQGGSSGARAASPARVAAVPPPVAQKQDKPAPASSPSGVGGARGAVSTSLGAAFSRHQPSVEVAQAKTIRKEAMAQVNDNYIPTHWTISPDGTTLLRSTDEGRSWTAVNVASNLVLRAIAALQPEVWVGGKAGALYYSSDLGAHWTQVKPTANGATLAADIVGIDFTDHEHGKITTAEGNIWTTNDAGKTWQMQ